MDLTQKKCSPCEGGMTKFSQEKAKALLKQTPHWQLNGDQLIRTFKFKNFIQAMKFVNHMADIAENEGHHPDFTVHYNQVEVNIWTHAIDGLSENDFILAAKLNQIDI